MEGTERTPFPGGDAVGRLIYVAGAYAAPTAADIDRNVARACALARCAAIRDYTVISPHAIGRQGCHGHPFEADEHTRVRALASGVNAARAVGMLGGLFWGISKDDYGKDLSHGTGLELTGWREGAAVYQERWIPTWNPAPLHVCLGWERWVESVRNSDLHFDLEAVATEIEERPWDAVVPRSVARLLEEYPAPVAPAPTYEHPNGPRFRVSGSVLFRNRMGRKAYVRLGEPGVTEANYLRDGGDGLARLALYFDPERIGEEVFRLAMDLNIFAQITVEGRVAGDVNGRPVLYVDTLHVRANRPTPQGS